MKKLKGWFLSFAIFFILAWTNLSYAKQELPSVVGDQLKLGLVHFPTSTHSPLAQAHFLLGLKYLHNFMYPLAFREFQLAQRQDPHFGLSYWGMAMCFKWELWSYENKKKGQQILQQLAADKEVVTTPIERGLIDAVSKVFAPGNQRDNDRDYMLAMKKLYQQYPQNPDIASFYVLSIMAYDSVAPTSQKNKISTMMDARRILNRLLPLNSGHPGLIHYYIHVNEMDEPSDLKSAMSIINNVEHYLSDSSHAMHMPSHIYTVLGEWKDSTKFNLLSIQASQRMCAFLDREHINLKSMSQHDIEDDKATQQSKPWTLKQKYACDADNAYHSLEWLQYAYLQRHEFNKANELLTTMRTIYSVEKEPMFAFWLYRMEARQILYSQYVTPLITMPQPLVEVSEDKAWASYSECGLLLADGLRAIQYKQTSFFSPIEARFQTVIDLMSAPTQSTFKKACQLNLDEFIAMKTLRIEKDSKTASQWFEKGYVIQQDLQSISESFVLPFIPIQELYAEVLLQHPTKSNLIKAIKLYQDELIFYPNRPQALDGLQRVKHMLPFPPMKRMCHEAKDEGFLG